MTRTCLDGTSPLAALRRAPRARRAYFQHLSLRHIMLSLFYFAALFWAIRQVMESNEVIQQVILGVVVGLGFCIFGMWAAMKMARYAFIGWIVFVIGYMIITGATTTFFAVPTLPILIGCIIYLSLRRRGNDQDALLWVLAVAAERGMPLAPGVQAFSGQVTRDLRGLDRIARRPPSQRGDVARCARQPAETGPSTEPAPDPDGLGVGQPGRRASRGGRFEDQACAGPPLDRRPDRLPLLARDDRPVDRRLRHVFHHPQVRGDLQRLRGRTAGGDDSGHPGFARGDRI